MIGLKGKNALVTGATSGIGQAIAIRLFLASNKATYITRQTLFIDGGLSLYADFGENWSA